MQGYIYLHATGEYYRAPGQGMTKNKRDAHIYTHDRFLDIHKTNPGLGFVPESSLITSTAICGVIGEAERRKNIPVATGVVDYFPDALQAVAECSKKGNDQHHPGKPLHWDRAKSTDEADALMRHFIDRGKRDSDGIRHSAKVAWRALALLQKEIEADISKPKEISADTSNPLRQAPWRRWDGGNCPVDGNTVVQFMMRNTAGLWSERASDLHWDHHGFDDDITHYRIDTGRPWVKHHGGECPVNEDVVVEYGTVEFNRRVHKAAAGWLDWSVKRRGGGIYRWRVAA